MKNAISFYESPHDFLLLCIPKVRYVNAEFSATPISTTHKTVILSEAYFSGVEGPAFAFEFSSFVIEQPHRAKSVGWRPG
jgi:hypothetical protein